MVLTNTLVKTTPTFYATTSTATSTIDHIGVHNDMADARIISCRVLRHQGRLLQLIRRINDADHHPVAMRCAAKLAFSVTVEKDRWDHAAAIRSWTLADATFYNFRLALQQWCDETKEAWAELESQSSTMQAEFLQNGFHDIAYEHYALKVSKKPISELNKHRIEILAERRDFILKWKSKLHLFRSSLLKDMFDMWCVTFKLYKYEHMIKKLTRAKSCEDFETNVRELNILWRRRLLHEAWKLARKLSRISLGPKSKPLGPLQEFKPNAATWSHFLAQSGPAGGCEATTIVENEILHEYEGNVESFFILRDQAREDMRGIIKALASSPNRKTASGM